MERGIMDDDTGTTGHSVTGGTTDMAPATEGIVTRAWLHLALLVAGLELLAVGTWFVLEGIRVDQADSMLVWYVAGAAVAASAIWFFGYRPQADEFVPACDDTVLRDAKERLERMDPVRLAEHVADLCERDGLADVSTVRVVEDAYAMDVHATRDDGSLAVMRCRSTDVPGPVAGAVVEDFALVPSDAGPRLLATTAGCFSAKAVALAADAGIVLLDRGTLAHWECDKDTPAGLRA